LKISIITPSYNQGQFIKETIESVLSQGTKNLEYIIMDGGSTDNTVEVIKEYGDKVQWKSEKDRGQTHAVNKGIKVATGDIIGWVNSDDIYYPEAFKMVLKIFEDNSNINVVYGNANHIDIDGNYMEDYYTEDFNFERLKEVCFICQPSVFFRRTAVEKYGYLDETLNFCMDYEFWIRLGKKESFYRINQVLAGSRLYADNKTLGCRGKVHQEINEMLKRHFGKVPSKWIYNLAHIICDERNIDRLKSSEDNYIYTKNLAKESIKLFWKYNKGMPLNELKTIMGWLKSARGNRSL
jgi:glycosyltransferase involved in cell wall biosynthesis